MLDTLVNRALLVAVIAAAGAALWFREDARLKEARILDLEIQNWGQRADNRALTSALIGRQRVEISYQDAIQGLDPDAFSAMCRAELGPTYDAIERMRNDAAPAAAGRAPRRLPWSRTDAKPSD